MSVTLSPPKKAFIAREIAAGGFKSEDEAVERALTLYERRLTQIRDAIATAEREIAEGSGLTLSADQHLAQIRTDAAKNR